MGADRLRLALTGGYYGELARSRDPAIRAGWRHRLEQAARFELVRALVRSGDVVLDLGCGTGALGDYLRDVGCEVAYRGVERAPGLSGEAAAAWGARIVVGDALEADLPGADVVVALGVMVDGVSLRSDAERFGRARRWLARVVGLAGRLGVVVALDHDAIEARPALAADPALGGVRRGEVPWLAEALEAPVRVEPALSTDLALLVGPDAGSAYVPAVGELITRALRGPWGASATAAERAWADAELATAIG